MIDKRKYFLYNNKKYKVAGWEYEKVFIASKWKLL